MNEFILQPAEIRNSLKVDRMIEFIRTYGSVLGRIDHAGIIHLDSEMQIDPRDYSIDDGTSFQLRMSPTAGGGHRSGPNFDKNLKLTFPTEPTDTTRSIITSFDDLHANISVEYSDVLFCPEEA